MKFVITIWFALFLTIGVAFAEESPFEAKYKMKPNVYTECHAGYLFIIAASQNGVAIMQVFKDAGDMVPKPVECGEDNE